MIQIISGGDVMKRQNLVRARKQKGKTQKEVAKDLGISAVYVRKLENGLSNPGRKTMILFEKYYGISMRELFDDIF